MRHKRMIRAICLWYATGGAVGCDDLMQEVLLQLWQSRDTLRTGCTIEQERAWVRLKCRSVGSHYHRRKRPPIVALNEDMPVAAPSETDHSETIAAMATALDERERRVLGMILEGYSIAEIAAKLDIKARSVSQLKWRIVQKMKASPFGPLSPGKRGGTENEKNKQEN